MQTHRPRFILVVLLLALLSIGAFLALTNRSQAQPLTAKEEIINAWGLAQASGTYNYHSQVQQVTYPVPKLSNTSRSPQEDTLTMSGSINLPAESMEMTLWQNAGGSLADGLSIRVEDGQTWARRGENDWVAIDDVANLFAPNNDPLSFVDSATNVQLAGTDTRQVGDMLLTYSRYTFDLDGAVYADNMRQQMEERLSEYGTLPNGLQLNTGEIYRNMTGYGELWLDSDGLPQRLEIFTDIPAYRENGRITADITTDFSEFDRTRIATASTGFFDSPQTWLSFRQVEIIETAKLTFGFLAMFMVIFLIVALFIIYRHKPQAYASFAIFMVIAMVLPPLLQAEQVHAFEENFRADKAEQEARTAEAEEIEEIRTELTETDWNPNEAPREQVAGGKLQVASGQSPTLQQAQGNVSNLQIPLLSVPMQVSSADATDTDGDGLTDSDEDYWGTCRYILNSTEYNNNASCTGVADPTDTDGDGLGDGVEVNELGTLPGDEDTDSDSISDGLEVGGFDYNGQTWYLNPTEADSNFDGIIDSSECMVWFDGSDVYDETAVCPDSDGDGDPDVFDADNDDDGVPDAEDMSMNVGGGTTFSNANPFELSIDNLTVDQPVLVNLQLRPTTSNNLTLYQHVLDWPSNDTEGQITRYNDTTWAEDSTNNTELQSSADNAGNGDVRLVPMLEITMPYSNGHYSNLPVTNSAPGSRVLGNEVDTWLDADQLDPFGITVSDIDLGSGETAAYLPLTTVTDDTDAIVAFSAQMLYHPSQGTGGVANWGNAHQYRVVWLAQMITDECVNENDDPDTCTRQDVMTVIHAYYEDWQLSGLEVSEEHGLSSALIYEDPANDADLDFNDQIEIASWGLSNSFMRGRDYYNNTTRAQGSDGLRDVTVANVDSQLDDWFGNERYLNIVQRDYDHQSYMAYFTSNEASDVLDTVFTPYANQTTPVFLYMHENESRSLNIDDLGGAINASTTLDLDPANYPTQILSSMSLTPYAYANGAWNGYDPESYLDLLAYRLETVSFFQPADSSDDATEEAEGKILWAQYYYAALMQGDSAITEIDAQTVWTESIAMPELTYTLLVPPGTTSGAGYIATLYVQTLVQSLATKIITTDTQFWKTLSQTYSNGRSPYVLKTFELEIKSVKFNGLLVLTIIAIAIGAALLAAGYFTGNDTLFKVGVIILNVVTIIVTIVYAINMINAMRLAYQAATGVIATTSAVLKAGRGFPALGVIGFVIGLGLTWGMFFFQMSGKSTIELHFMLAYAIAFTIILVVLLILDFIGLGILTLLITLVDVILTLFGETGFTQMVAEWLADLLYDVNMVITNLEDSNRIDINLGGLTFADDDLGFTAGNSVTFSFDVTNTLRYDGDYSFGRANDTVFRYYLERTANEYHEDLDFKEMEGEWQDLGNRYIRVSEEHDITIPFSSYGIGLNRSVPLYMTEAFKTQYEGCWFYDGWFGADGCTWETIAQTSNIDLGTYMVYDILPGSIASFARMDWNNGSPAFPTQVDIDNDTLTNNDPYPESVDGDGDGLTDLYEINNGLDPHEADGDGDGLTDAEELDYGTNPNLADSDGDLLNDRIEVVEGWLIPYNNGTQLTRVWSDPNVADADEDSLTDFDEFLFGFNPWVPTDPSLIQDLVKFDDLGVNEVSSNEMLLRFEETAVIAGESFIFGDSSGENNVAVCDNGTGACPLNAVNGRYRYALDFDGSNDQLTVSDIDLANQSFTLAAWAQRDGTGNDYILSQGTASNNQGLQFGFSSGNQFFCGFYGPNIAVSSATYTDNDWHHWACTYDADSNALRLYRDGTSVASMTTSADYQGNGDLLIGQRFSSGIYAFDGAIDEVAIFSKAMDVTGVQDLLNGRYNPNDLLVAPGADLTYNATVTNTTSTNATGFLVPNTTYIEPEIAQPAVALSFEPEQKLTYFENVAGEENAAYCVADGTCPTVGTNGRIGNGIIFDGVDDVVHIPTMFIGNTFFHFSFWIWVDSLPAAGERAMIFDTESTLDGGLDLYINSSGNLVFDIEGASADIVSNYSFSGNLNRWVHISDNGRNLHINGTVASEQSLWDGDQNVAQIGYGTMGNSVDGTAPLDGRIDEIVYFDDNVDDGTGGSNYNYNQMTDDIMQGDYFLEQYYTGGRDQYPTVLFTLEEINAYDGTIFYDSQTNSNHATCSGNSCPTLTDETGGATGRAAVFDGVDDILTQPGSYTTPNSGTNQQGETSLTVWVYLDSYPTAGNQAYILDTTSGDDKLDLYIDSAGKFVADRDAGSPHDSTATIPLNTWTKIYLYYDLYYHTDSNYYYDSFMYINDVFDSDHNYGISSSTHSWDYDLTVGPGYVGNDASGNNSFTGRLDELQLSGLASIDFDPPSSNIGYENLANELRTATCSDIFVCPADTTGRFDQGVLFDGDDDYLDMGKVDFAQGDYTISTWFNSSASGANQDILSAWGALTGQHGVLLELVSDGRLRYLHRFPTGSSGGSNIYSSASYNDGGWHHLTAVRAGNSMTLYVDGVEVGSNTATENATEPLEIVIGQLRTDNAARPFNGILDELLIIPAAVSVDGVQLLMNSTFPVIDVPDLFTEFSAGPLATIDVVGNAAVSDYATSSRHQFDLEVEAALELQTQIDYPVIDDNSADVTVFLPFEETPGSTQFDNLIDVTNTSGDQVEAVCTGSACPTAGVRGQVDRAVYFDGKDDYLELDLDYSTYVGADTMAVWVNGKGGTIAQMRYIHVDFNRIINQRTLDTIALDLPRDEWFHLVVVGGSTTTVYVNGVQVASGSFSSGGSINEFFIGANTDGQDQFEGFLDDLRLYDAQLTAPQVQTLYEESAPVMRFEFDEDGEATAFLDNSVNGYVGVPTTQTYFEPTLQQNVTTYNPLPGTDGKIGNTALFDGNGRIEVAEADAVDFADDFSVVLWLKTTETGVGLLAKTDDDQSWEVGEKLFYLDNNGYPTFVGYGNGFIRSATAVNDDVWHQIGVSWDATTGGKIYLDGQDITTSSSYTATNADRSGDTIKIGAPNYNEASNFFVGEMDELAVYGRSMTQPEIFSIYLREYRWYRARTINYVQVDTDAPTIELLTTDNYFKNGYIQLAVATRDLTSRVTLLDFGVRGPSDSEFSWQGAPVCAEAYATNAAWCPFFDTTQLEGEGVYEVQFRAVDAVGNETTSAVTVFRIDGQAPTANTSPYNNSWQPLVADGSQEFRWTVALAGTITDPAIGGVIPGSGPVTGTTTVSLLDATGQIVGTGLPQPVNIDSETATSFDWSLDYIFDGQKPTGVYTITIQTEDAVGNKVDIVWDTIRLDGRSPSATFNDWNAPNNGITQTITLDGVVVEQPDWGGTVAEFHFEETNGATTFYDSSGNYNHATCSNCPATGNGLFGNAADFDGANDVLNVAADDSLNVGPELTIAAWINPDSISTGVARIITLGNAKAVLRVDGSERLHFYMTLDGTPQHIRVANVLSTNQWQHVAGSYDGETMRLYHNGVEVDSLQVSGSVDSSNDLTINSGTESFDGQIDEVVVYGRSLSAAEIYAMGQREVRGVAGVELWFEEIFFDGSQDTENWQSANVSGGTWSFDVPTGLEGFYDIHLRSSDNAGNQAVEGVIWRGSMDTEAPRITGFSGQHGGGGSAAYTEYSFNIEDIVLDIPGLIQPCAPESLSNVQYTYPDNPLNGETYQTSTTCRVTGHDTGDITITACDFVGHCSTDTINLTSSPDTASVSIFSPTQNATITLTQPISITGGAFAPDNIDAVTISVDGALLDSFSYGGTESDTTWATNWWPTLAGTYQLTAVMTDTLNATYTDTIDVTLTGNLLFVNVDGTGIGTVNSEPLGIDCGVDCMATFTDGTTITLTAVPDISSHFVAWDGACTGNGDCIFDLNTTETVTATFDINQYDLTIIPVGDGSGVVSSDPLGIDCGVDCVETLNHGTVVTLTGIPDAGSVFNGWSGPCTGNDECVVTMTDFITATAEFLDDSNVGLTIDSTTIDLSEGGVTDVYTISLNTNPTAPVTVTFGTDANVYPIGEIVLTNSEPQTITVTSVDDGLVEGDHVSTITHTTSSADPYYDNATVANVVATIEDNDVQYELFTATTSLTELDLGASTTVTYTITRTGDISRTSNVNMDWLASMAELLTDFDNVQVSGTGISEANGTITFTTGVDLAMITVDVLGDDVDEDNEDIVLTLSAGTGTNGSGTAVYAQNPITTTIVDDDTRDVLVVGADAGLSVTEAGITDTYSIALASEPTAPVTITIGIDNSEVDIGAGAGNPISLTYTTLTWMLPQTITVTAIDDLSAESTHFSILSHTVAGGDYGLLTPANITVTIEDNDIPEVTIAPPSLVVTETGVTTADFVMTLETLPTDPVTVTLTTDDATECTVAPSSLALTPLTWNTGVTATVTSVDENVDDEDQLCHVITSAAISDDPDYFNLGVPDVPVTVIDDDGAPSINFTMTTMTTTEEAEDLLVLLSLSNPSAFTVEVDVTSADNGATAGLDYTAVSETITFAPLETTTTITLPILEDGIDEPTEALTLTLSNPVQATLGLMDRATVEIEDDDAPARISIADSSAPETDLVGSMTFTVSLNIDSAFPITVDYSTQDGTAVAGEHYTATVGTLTFNPGDTEQFITVPIIGNEMDHDNYYFEVLLSNPTSASIEDNTAIGWILDDDYTIIFLPLVMNDYPLGPDLIVEELTLSGNDIEVTIRNQGDMPVTNAFWVDVYINPTVPPTTVNQTIETLNSFGAVWGVTRDLAAGESLTLRLNDSYFQPSESNLPVSVVAGTAVYAQVDSAHNNQWYGAVYESHERREQPYNNILSGIAD